MTQHQPLDLPTVESIFARLVVTYGRWFMAQYDAVDLDAVMSDWTTKISPFSPEAIEHALGNLPPKPLNVEQFRLLCREYRSPAQAKALAAPVVKPSKHVRQAMSKLAVPLQDQRPERVRVAERYIDKWGNPGQLLSPHQRNTLTDYRKVLERWTQSCKEVAHAAE